ncbi:hypothetical protein [Krasilnikovia sp. MM14-A1259]|uniref:hypothetical protein n=1 Tax=Krasilnikovia sp. MM14-A1259 TaxID=3373539 RepID=UPI00382B559A
MSYGDTSAGQQRRRPQVVEIGASLLAVVGVLITGRVAYGVVVTLGQRGWTPGARGVFLLLNSFVLIFGVFLLVLAYQVRRGRLWAWIVSLVILPLTALFGGLTLLIAILSHDVSWGGAAVALVSVAALVTLTISRSGRDYFVSKPPPAVPMHAGPVGYPWGPGHPPA